MGCALLWMMGASADAAPKRVMSLNPCVDSLLMYLADASHIVALSPYARDPRASSITPAQARRFPTTSGTAEEVIAYNPDLVIASPHATSSTLVALERFKIPLIRMGVPQTVAESDAQIRQLAQALGHPARGDALIARIHAALDAATPQDNRSISALIWQSGGLVPGVGTLADALLTRTGYRNMSAVYGLQAWDLVSLEDVVARPPRVIFSATERASHADSALDHPVLAHLSARTVRVPYDPRLLYCAGPTLMNAAAYLAATRSKLVENQR